MKDAGMIAILHCIEFIYTLNDSEQLTAKTSVFIIVLHLRHLATTYPVESFVSSKGFGSCCMFRQ